MNKQEMADQEPKANSSPCEQPPPQRKHVLMLEDEVDFAALLKMFLESKNFKVTCVTSGVEGMRRVVAQDFDVILSDLVMPDLPGDLFYKGVERAKPHLCKRFVFMSGHRADPYWQEFIRQVDVPVIWKPFPMRELEAAVQKALEP